MRGDGWILGLVELAVAGLGGVGRANLNRRKRDEADEKTILASTHLTYLFFNIILLLNVLVCCEYGKKLVLFVAD